MSEIKLTGKQKKTTKRRRNNTYAELRVRHQDEFNAFPMAFAFSDKQFDEGMRKLGLDPTETDKIYGFAGTGGFYRRNDADALHEMLDRHEKERQDAMAGDSTGDGYIFDMFFCELAGHEYDWTCDLTDTLEVLDLTMEDIERDERLQRGLKKAMATLQEAAK
jgi:hypothetical protein